MGMKIRPELEQQIMAQTRGLSVTGVNPLALRGSRGVATVATPLLLDGADEFTFQTVVVSLFEANGWTVAHCRKVRTVMGGGNSKTRNRGGGEARYRYETTMPAGWPDLFVLRGDRSFFSELKVPPNTQTPDQKKWQRLLEEAGHRYYLWHPADTPLITRIATQPAEE